MPQPNIKTKIYGNKIWARRGDPVAYRLVSVSVSVVAAAAAAAAPCHGLLSQVSDDVTLRHCCSFTYSPTVIQRKPPIQCAYSLTLCTL